jgi:ParB/RepB/Spo0J family partition protein
MSIIKQISLSKVDPNPYRMLGDYPYSEEKLSVLVRSIKDVGLWEGVIGREKDDRVQIAFGHHRIEAAKRAGLSDVNVVVRDLSDDDMLRFMGRENGEDYRTDFLVLLETWEAACKNFTSREVKVTHPIEIAKFLGWTRDRTNTDKPQMNRSAEAANSAFNLIEGGYLQRSDLEDLTVNEAREICTRAQTNMKRLDAMGKQGNRPAAEIEKSKKQVAKAVKATAKQSREGQVAQKDLRSTLDVNTYRLAKEAKVKEPLFAQFGNQLADRISAMLNDDVNAGKLENIIDALDMIENEQDHAVVTSIKANLKGLSERSMRWRSKMSKEKVVELKAIEGGADV